MSCGTSRLPTAPVAPARKTRIALLLPCRLVGPKRRDRRWRCDSRGLNGRRLGPEGSLEATRHCTHRYWRRKTSAAARSPPELIEGHAGRSYAIAATRIFFRELPTTPAPRWR